MIQKMRRLTDLYAVDLYDWPVLSVTDHRRLDDLAERCLLNTHVLRHKLN